MVRYLHVRTCGEKDLGQLVSCEIQLSKWLRLTLFVSAKAPRPCNQSGNLDDAAVRRLPPQVTSQHAVSTSCRFVRVVSR